eukprot:869609-Rhodomonas_salina.1
MSARFRQEEASRRMQPCMILSKLLRLWYRRVEKDLDFADKRDTSALLARVLRVLDVQRDFRVAVDVARVRCVLGQQHERLSIVIEQVAHQRACEKTVKSQSVAAVTSKHEEACAS